MVLLSISSITSWSLLLLIIALIIWFFANKSLKGILSKGDFNDVNNPKSGSLKVIDGKNVRSLSAGFNMNLQGKANKIIKKDFSPKTFALKPKDYVGLQPIPKILVKEGDTVKAGDKIFFDRKLEGIFFTAPVSGTVSEIRRGEKRSIAEIVITADGKNEFKKFKANITDSREGIVEVLVESGAFTGLTQRPFGLPAMPDQKPRAIFISAFDTSPLAADLDFVIDNLSSSDFQKGLDVLNKLTNKVHLNVKTSSNAKYLKAKGVQINYFEGQDPAGKVGIQIHHIDAIKKGEVVWTINPTDVVTIGKLFNEGIYDPSQIVAVAGTPFEKTCYIKTKKGASIESLVSDLSKEDNRIIAGNVLSGKKIESNGHLGAFDNTLSVIKEGGEYEMFGWLIPQFVKPTISETFPWAGNEKISFDAKTNMNGEPRAFVVTGQYEEVLPMDVYPVHLLKSILVQDFDQMEGLGIYELIEEDVALCEFVCTSKQPVQQILRDGLDYIYSQS